MSRAGFEQTLKFVFHSEDATAVIGQVLDIHAHPAAVIEYVSFDKVAGSPQDHFQAALLSGAPDIGGFTPLGSFV